MWTVILLALGLILLPDRAHGQRISKHDFTTESWNPLEKNRLCGVCHAPHDQAADSAYAKSGLIWNHKLSSATYVLYDSNWSSTIDGTVSQPSGSSVLCLSCHDGSVELGHLTGASIPSPDRIGASMQVPSPVYGINDLTGNHPFSITYDPAKDDELKAIGNSFGISGAIKNVLEDGRVECSTCHDVHENKVPTGASNLLRIGNTNSELCLACHDK